MATEAELSRGTFADEVLLKECAGNSLATISVGEVQKRV
jgi:hypothetical protein